MATKRQRGAGWEYVVKRKGLMSRPLYLTFSSEDEGDGYVRNWKPSSIAVLFPMIFVQGKARSSPLKTRHVSILPLITYPIRKGAASPSS